LQELEVLKRSFGRGLSGGQQAYIQQISIQGVMRDERIVVTGGAGFIGSNIARTLCEENEVIVIDNLLTGRYENISGIADRIKFVRDDVNSLNMLMREFKCVDYILHQAALPSVQRSVDDPVTTNRNNIDGMLNVLVAARDCGVKRVVFASSSAIYGDASEMPLRETVPPKPLSPYAVTKLTGEHYCKVFHEVYGLETVSLRYFNVFGPGQDPSSDYAAVIPKFVKAIKTGGQPMVYGDGEQTRDFVYVKDVVRANVLACESKVAAGNVLNIAAGKGTSLNQLLDTLGIVTSTKMNPIYADPRPGDIRDSVADISQAKELLGYGPEVGVEKGLRAMLSCWRD
jgi:nucleoside-diphosphate-sugar epimerase